MGRGAAALFEQVNETRPDMGTSAIKTDPSTANHTAPERADQFAFELSELGRRYGVGLGGSPVLFQLERDDYGFDYSVDGQSRLRLGNAEGNAASGSRRNA
jgi:hypothetical protein